jgi:hypothetical protein
MSTVGNEVHYHRHCEVGRGSVGNEGGALQRVAQRHGATVYQVALAWVLARSPAMLVIPGTSKSLIWRRTSPRRKSGSPDTIWRSCITSEASAWRPGADRYIH